MLPVCVWGRRVKPPKVWPVATVCWLFLICKKTNTSRITWSSAPRAHKTVWFPAEWVWKSFVVFLLCPFLTFCAYFSIRWNGRGVWASVRHLQSHFHRSPIVVRGSPWAGGESILFPCSLFRNVTVPLKRCTIVTQRWIPIVADELRLFADIKSI